MSTDLLDTPSEPNKNVHNHKERFLKAFEDYSDALFRHAFYRLSDRERAIELVHDTYTKVWSYVQSGSHIGAYRAFLYKILNNLIIDEYRKKKELSLDTILSEQGADERYFEELHEGSLEETVLALDAKKVLTHLTEIPEQYREVIVLRYIDGLGPKEISQLVEVSENIVSLRIHRGLKALKHTIEAHEKEAEDNARHAH